MPLVTYTDSLKLKVISFLCWNPTITRIQDSHPFFLPLARCSCTHTHSCIIFHLHYDSHNLYKNEQLFTEQSAATRASSSTKSTTISFVTTTPGGMTEDVTETTKADSDVTRQRDTALKTLRQNESKSQEVTTVMPGGVGSITGDNQMMTTPIPQDLQLSESITSVYLHNSSSVPAVSNNIETSEPKKDPNSISLVPFSKLTHHIRDSSSSTSAPVTSESVFTVTPVSTEASSTMMTYDDLRTSTVTLDTTEMTTMMDIYSGQYHEVNPGQYHEINPGQYHEANPGNGFYPTLSNCWSQN